MEYFQMFFKGGAVMFLIAGCSLIAVFIYIQKWFQFHRDKVNVKELVSGLLNVLKRDGMIEAITLCDNTPGPVAHILTAAIQAYQNDDDIKQSIEDASMMELPLLESRLNILATITYIAPLLGLFGTVIGMADAFHAIQMTRTLTDLSGGVYMALTTTAAGLGLAIVCNIGYNYLVSRVQSLCVDMEKASSEILYFFNHHKRGQNKNAE